MTRKNDVLARASIDWITTALRIPNPGK